MTTEPSASRTVHLPDPLTEAEAEAIVVCYETGDTSPDCASGIEKLKRGYWAGKVRDRATKGRAGCSRCEGDGYIELIDPDHYGAVIGIAPCPDCEGSP